MKFRTLGEMSIEELLQDFILCLGRWKKANLAHEVEAARLLQDRMEELSSEMVRRKVRGGTKY